MSGRKEEDAAGVKILHGKYKTFFKQSAHSLVESWYNSKTTEPHRRRQMKTLVKMILDFDAKAAKARIRATDRADVIGANAIYDQHNGALLLSSEAAEKTVVWLSFATPSQKQMFRDTFGHMKPASLFSSSRQYTDDFSVNNKITPTDQRTQKPRSLLGTQYEHKFSGAITSESLVIGRHPTSTGTNFVWKVQPQLATNAQLRAHDSTFLGSAPWGDYGKEHSSNKTQWQSKSTEDFSGTQYDAAPGRSFQNYNENFCTDLYKNSKKAASVQKMQAEIEMHRANQQMESTGKTTLAASPPRNPRSGAAETRSGGRRPLLPETLQDLDGSLGGVPAALSATQRQRPRSMLEVGMTALLTNERKYQPKLREPVHTPSFRKPAVLIPPEDEGLLLLGTVNAPPPRQTTTVATERANANTTVDLGGTGGSTKELSGSDKHGKFAKVSGVGVGAGKTPDHGMDPEFVSMVMRIRNNNYPLMHTGLPRRKQGLAQFHSRE